MSIKCLNSFQIVSLEEALTVIKAMQAKCCHCRGQQIIAYRKKVRQQVNMQILCM